MDSSSNELTPHLTLKLAGGITLLGGLSYLLLHMHRKHQSLLSQLAQSQKNRESERTERTRAEKKLRKILQDQYPLGSPSFAQPVATVRSPYPDRRGTPRQGMLITSARAYLQMNPTTHPKLSLSGLDQFSHLWLITVFHENTNLTKLVSSSSSENEKKKNKNKKNLFSGVKALVCPPRLGKEVGVFSTRSPHRYNPIALSVVRIESIDLDRGRIYVSGIDLLDQTPVLDVKPYIARYDCIADAVSPDWVNVDTKEEKGFGVRIPERVQQMVENCFEVSDFFCNVEGLFDALEGILAQDIRSRYQQGSDGRGDGNGLGMYELRIDCYVLEYSVSDSLSEVCVHSFARA